MKRTKIKVLSCPFSASLMAQCRYAEVPVVFGRNGLYLVEGDCWLEQDGKAFAYPADDFRARLADANAAPLTIKDCDDLKRIVRRHPDLWTPAIGAAIRKRDRRDAYLAYSCWVTALKRIGRQVETS